MISDPSIWQIRNLQRYTSPLNKENSRGEPIYHDPAQIRIAGRLGEKVPFSHNHRNSPTKASIATKSIFTTRHMQKAVVSRFATLQMNGNHPATCTSSNNNTTRSLLSQLKKQSHHRSKKDITVRLAAVLKTRLQELL